VNVVAFVIAMGIFVFGLWLMSIAPEVVGFQAVAFFVGILCATVAVAIPINLLGRADGV
jgi:uncharacterized membrane protein YiaA